jgi:hypothetical protein
MGLWGANITSVLTQASASHPPELPGLDLPLDTVPEGWPRRLSVSTPRHGWSIGTPQLADGTMPEVGRQRRCASCLIDTIVITQPSFSVSSELPEPPDSVNVILR